MPLKLLDGTSAAFSFQTDVNSADLLAAGSGSFPAGSTNFDAWTCVANELSLELSQTFIDKTTFCSNRWVGRTVGRRDISGRLSLIESKGTPVSNPAYLFSTTSSIPMLATLDVGCTLSAMIVGSRRTVGARAYDNYSGSLEFMTDGQVYSPAWVWVTS
jgi:hypothetical protein